MRHTCKVPSDANTPVIDAFREYLRVEKGLASLTLSAYTRDIQQFAGFLQGHKCALLNARRDDVRAFIQQMFSNSVDGRSVARKLSALRHLYRYLLLDKRIERDPTLNVPLPKQWKILPKSLAREEVVQMLESSLGSATGAAGSLGLPVARGKQAQALGLRNRAMFEVFYAGALRVSEIVSLRMEDVKLEMGYVLVQGKGDKERIVPLGRAAQAALTTYLRDARGVLAAGKTSPFLFIT